MLFTHLTEIKSILPTSKWDKFGTLRGLLEEEEDNHLRPILGDTLFDKIVEDYDQLAANEFWFDQSTDKDRVRIIRTCQKVAFYMMLANNSGLFSVSFNAGGGFNSMSADDYSQPSTDAIKRFERDAWGKGRRNIDTLLRLLERDAQQTAPLYREQWRKSRYFYRQANLLFTTAVELQQYLDIKESREKYITLVPCISYAQSVYIIPRIGQPLFDWLIGLKYGTASPSAPSGSTDPSAPSDPPLPPSPPSPTLLSFRDKVMSACALYVEHSEKDLRRDDSLSRADMQIALAIRIIKENAKMFVDLVGITDPKRLNTVQYGIPVDLPPDVLRSDDDSDPTVPEASPSGKHPHHPHPHHHTYDPHDPNNAVFAPFGTGLRRY